MRTLTATAADGTALVADEYGPAGETPVVCLPGLTRNARDFADLAAALSAPDETPPRRVIVLESRGRGRSGRADGATYTLLQELDDLLAALKSFDVARAAFVGTSRGGLLTMLLAMRAPEMISRVVLNDIGPRIEPEGLARIGESVGTTMAFKSFEDLGARLEKALGPQFPALGPDGFVRLARQLASEDGEGVRFDYDPALADPFRATNAPIDPPDFWPGFDALLGVPVMVIRGAHSDLLSAATVEAMRRRHARLTTFIAHGEGHAPLLWDAASQSAIQRFLSA
ncbi:MAG: alpha/beta hydrolase [Pseudomonadota bacterium]